MDASRSMFRFISVVAGVFFMADLVSAGLGGASALAGTARPAAAASAARPASPAFNTGWKQAPVDAGLSGVSCVSASDCLAVGSYIDAAGGQRSAAQVWNGHIWRVIGSVPGHGLSGVSCTSATFCLAIGSVVDKWTGRSWKQLNGPGGLSGIACLSTSFCMAVGNHGGTGNLAAEWNGRTWKSLKTPGNGCDPECGLSGVACLSHSDCLAVGGTGSNSGLSDFSEGMKWNGHKWMETPTPAPDVSSSLSGISCVNATRCVAVGNFTSESPSCNCVLAASWNGSRWTQLSAPAVGPSLSAVSCPAANDCVAVGGNLDR
jgi:hypothetical protein